LLLVEATLLLLVDDLPAVLGGVSGFLCDLDFLGVLGGRFLLLEAAPVLDRFLFLPVLSS
jgi:hypothetical protein